MPEQTQFVFFDNQLKRIGVRNIVSASYSRRLNRVGSCTVLMDAKENDFEVFSQEDLGLIIQVADEINPIMRPDLEAFWILEDFNVVGSQRNVYQLEFVDAIDLLKRHRVAYFADVPQGASPQARVNEPGNVALKRIFDENMGALAGTRNLEPFVTSASVSFPSPLIHKTIQFKNILSAMTQIAKASREKGTTLYFDLRARESEQFGVRLEFVTFTGARGKDHTDTNLGDVRVRVSDPNFVPDTFRISYNRPNVAYVAGSGSGPTRPLVEVSNDRATAGIFTRRETYKSIQTDDIEILRDEARELISAQGIYSLTGDLIGELANKYRYGDILNIEYENLVIRSEIAHVNVEVTQETYTKSLRIESI